MLHMIINPTAGNGRAVRVGEQAEKVLKARGIDYRISRTEYAGHATELAQAAATEGATTVIAVGGDGTVLETARGIIGTEAALGIVPAGTGNDVVKMLGVPSKPLEALDYLLGKEPRLLDAGCINDKLFLNVCGTGFDVAVLDRALTAKRFVRGMLPYLWGVICTIFTYKPVEITYTIDDGAPQTREVLLIAIANGRYIGGGLNVAPDARPDDGLFDVVTIDNMPRWKLPPHLIRLLTGNILKIPGTVGTKCRKVTASAKGMRMNIDGEIVPMDQVTLEIQPKALHVHW